MPWPKYFKLSENINNTVRQTFILSVSNALTRFMGMVFFIILARSLTVSEYGLFRYLLTLSTIYGLAVVGVPTALTRFLGESTADHEKKTEYFANSLFLCLLLFLVLTLIVFLFASHKILLILFIFAYLVDLFYIGYARGMLNYLKLNGFKLLENIFQLAILTAAYLIYRKVDLNFSTVFYSFSGILSLSIFEIIRPDLKIKWHYSRQRLVEILRYAAPVTLGAVGMTLLFGISSIYIEKFYDTEQVGYFSVGLTLMQIFSFLPEAIYTIMMPKAAGLKDKHRILRPLRLAILGSLGMSIIIFVPLYYFRGFVVSFLFSPKYLPAVATILPQTVCQVFLMMNQFYGTAWQGLGKPAFASIIISIAAGVNLVLGYFFTKGYGIVGASVALAISSFAAWMISLIVWRWWLKRGGLDLISMPENAV